ncbi:EAL domain-containing protein [Alicyclobacillus sp. TC]|uniref:GGDEF domain-containing phosphodiesterase n=1 Tax=Alicyclobacillus sp. TC TaxID=2606450 RepID=UPI0019344FAB|nr:GGDEF domain-containing phosphodiesterase [Alicyclobacillus sp. TC]QRF24117.1 EAL domain-containing protein [Alicyclobacillus sp. TC]
MSDANLFYKKQMLMVPNYSHQSEENLFEQFFVHHPDGLCCLNEEGCILDINPAGLALFGYQKDWVVGHDLSEFLQWTGSREDIKKEILTVMQGKKKSFQLSIRHADGHIIDMAVSVIPHWKLGQVIGVLGIFRDVSQENQISRELRSIRSRLSAMLESLEMVMWSVNLIKDEILFCSSGVERLVGYTSEELVLSKDLWRSIFHPEDDWLREQLVDSVRQGNKSKIIHRVFHKNGSVRFMATHGVPVFDEGGNLIRMDGLSYDMTEYILKEQELGNERKKFYTVLELIPDPIVIHHEGQLDYLNPAACQLFGVVNEKARTQSVFSYCSPDARDFLASEMQQLVSSGNTHSFVKHELVLLRSDGTEFIGETTCKLFYENNHPAIVTLIRDVTERRQQYDYLARVAYVCPLTQLPNRNRFLSIVEETMRSTVKNMGFAVLMLNIDRFKYVNDSFGYSFGDSVIREVADRLSRIVASNGVVARMGGDEFGILFESESQAFSAANRILKQFETPLTVQGKAVYLTLSMGLAAYPRDGEESEGLLKHADVALYAAKEAGGNCLRRYQSLTHSSWLDNIQLDAEMRKALEQQEFVLYYQPKIDMRTRRIVAMEALLRWVRGDGKSIPPSRFITLAEQTGFIVNLGVFAMREACRQMMEWRARGLQDVKVSVNVSIKQFLHANMLEQVQQTLSAVDMPPSLLDIEITESVLMQNQRDLVSILKHLLKLGVDISIDDFGTGYSSFGYLREFMPSSIKIDQSFIHRMKDDWREQAIVSTLVQMAHNLHLNVVAEGVETEEQLEILQTLGCDVLQGFYFSPPVSSERMNRMLLEEGYID